MHGVAALKGRRGGDDYSIHCGGDSLGLFEYSPVLQMQYLESAYRISEGPYRASKKLRFKFQFKVFSFRKNKPENFL